MFFIVDSVFALTKKKVNNVEKKMQKKLQKKEKKRKREKEEL